MYILENKYIYTGKININAGLFSHMYKYPDAEIIIDVGIHMDYYIYIYLPDLSTESSVAMTPQSNKHAHFPDHGF